MIGKAISELDSSHNSVDWKKREIKSVIADVFQRSKREQRRDFFTILL